MKNEINEPQTLENLRTGDRKLIAEMTGLSYGYVCQVLDPEDPRKNDRVWEAAAKIISNREALRDSFVHQK